MDAVYFLKSRTNFIRRYYDTALKPFMDVKGAIENELPPFEPEYSEDGEPQFLDQWVGADTAGKILGLTCVSLLSDSLKLYFETLQHHVIGFGLGDGKTRRKAFEQGFVHAYLGALGYILDTDWSGCPADRAVIEQIVLVRNRGQHPAHFTSLGVDYNADMLKKYPNPFFASPEERETWSGMSEAASMFLMPEIQVTRDKLFGAIGEVEKLAEWIDGRMDRAMEWRERNR